MKFDQALENFLIYLKAKGDTDETVKTYRVRIRYFYQFVEKTELEEIDLVDVDKWVVSMRGKKLSKATIRGRSRNLKSFFAWCVSREYLAESPAAHLSIKKERIDNDEVKAIPEEDLKKMIQVAEEQEKWRDVALLWFIASTGCRVGEVAKLTRQNLSLTKREAQVIGKNKKGTVDFGPITVKALRKWFKARPNTESKFVFTSLAYPYGQITSGAIYQAFRRIARTAGINRFNPHSIRHYVGQKWTDETNLELTRQKLRHADISTTIIYANQDRSRLKKKTSELEDI